MSDRPLSERIRALMGWFDPEFAPQAQVVNGLANEVRELESSTPQIIRTVAELEALDPETVVWPARHYGPYPVGTIAPDPFNPYWTPPLPAVVIRDGADVRAARKALEEA